MHMSSDDVISVSSYQSNKVCCRSKLRSPDIQKAKAQQKSPNGFLIKAFNLKHKTCTPNVEGTILSYMQVLNQVKTNHFDSLV